MFIKVGGAVLFLILPSFCSMLSVGDYTLQTLNVQEFSLDGGSVFGVVPRVLWEKVIPPDHLNRVRLSMRILLIRGKGRNILVDAAMGTAWSSKMRSIYDLSEWRLDEELQKAGLNREKITDVIFTHLHFDHVGGAFEEKDGELAAVFPNARYYVQKENYETAFHPNMKEKPSYPSSFIRALGQSGSMELVDGIVQLSPGIEMVPMGHGHTAGHQLVKISGEEKTVVHGGDLIPSSAHLGVIRGLAYDIAPLEVIREKIVLLDNLISGNWILYFAHDPFITAATLREGEKHVVVDREVAV